MIGGLFRGKHFNIIQSFKLAFSFFLQIAQQNFQPKIFLSIKRHDQPHLNLVLSDISELATEMRSRVVENTVQNDKEDRIQLY